MSAHLFTVLASHFIAACLGASAVLLVELARKEVA